MSEAMQALFAGDRSRAEALLPADDQLTLHQAAAFGRVGRIEEILAADPKPVNELSPADGPVRSIWRSSVGMSRRCGP
jgi:hypothetical protein